MTEHPTLCFLGPHVGRRAGYVTVQDLVLADLLRKVGYPIISASSSLSRIGRLIDMLRVVIANRRRIDIVHLSIYSGLSFVNQDAVSWLCRMLRLPMIMTLHGGGLPEFTARYPRWTHRILKRAEVIVAPSPFLANAVGQHGFQAQVIPNVADPNDYPFRERSSIRPVMFWMRTFHDVYNPEMAIRVLSQVRQRFPEARLIMAGQDKGALSEVKILAQRLDLVDAVEFPGFLNLTDKQRIGDQADIFLNTNRVDNMPVAVIEACAMGLPVVATRVGGIPFLLTDAVTGLLVPENDHHAMAQAVIRLMESPDLAQALSRNGRALAERSAWANVYPLWEKLFAEVQKPRRGEIA